jgi:sugar phosphate isomerase/epimerase
MMTNPMNRRQFLALSATGITSAVLTSSVRSQEKPKPTRFQVGCMTLPYSAYPLERALSGMKTAGFDFVAWGTTHQEKENQRTAVIASDAPPEKAKELGQRCRDLGLEPLMMFSGIYPEAKNHLEVMKNRIKQASAAGIPHLLTFGHTKDGETKFWVDQFKALGPIAADNGVLIVIKQHGGLTGTGEGTAAIVKEIAHDSVKVNYDAGNVMDYSMGKVDPLPDIIKCADQVRSFCLKDHRMWPKNEDCAPGFGEIDHYKLLKPVAWTGRPMPLCFENIFIPAVARPTKPEGIDALAKRAREFIELVIQGVQS